MPKSDIVNSDALRSLRKIETPLQELTVGVNVGVAPMVWIIVHLGRCDWRREIGMRLEM